jgi:2'-5' RNA ligase
MRLFVALEPPAHVLTELDAAVAPLRPRWPELRWASVDRWHVTLAFLGEVDEVRLGDLHARLGRAASRHQSLDVRIGRGGAFPSVRRARVLCAHIEGEGQAMTGLSALAASVAAAARRAGAPPPDEGRRYRPHLTLARCKQPTDLGMLTSSLSGFIGTTWPTSQVHLIRSLLGPSPRYETLASWPLGFPLASGRL